MIAARLGCAIPTKKTGDETFVQIVTNEPLLECRVLASAVGPNREEAIRVAMAAAGVTKLAEGPQPLSKLASDLVRLLEYVSPHERGIRAALKRCANEISELTGVLRGH